MSNNYWSKRFEAEENRVFKETTKEIEQQIKMFEETQESIQAKIMGWYARFQKNNGMDFNTAVETLDKKELKELKWSLKDYTEKAKNYPERYRKELENASIKVHIDKLTALQLQISAELNDLYGEVQRNTEKHIKREVEETYYRTAYEIAKGTKQAKYLQKLDNNLIDHFVRKVWASDGKNFSNRIWENKQQLTDTLYKELTHAVIRGDHPDKVVKAVENKVNAKKSNIERLVYTEMAAYSSKARQQNFEDLGVERYEIVATLDGRTSSICRSLDGKVFDMKDYNVGTTAPPFHPSCRTVTAPYFGDTEGERAARGENGKTYYVPDNLKYPEWKEKYVKSNFTKRDKADGTYRKLGNFEDSGYNRPEELLRSYEKKILKNNYESAMVVLENGDIYVVRGKSTAVNPEIIRQNLKGAYITHNHPKGKHEWGFSNTDFDFFVNNNLKYLSAIDEKYTHELSKELFDMRELRDIKLDGLDYNKFIEQNQRLQATLKGLKYRRVER